MRKGNTITITGRVVAGSRLGRTLGYPTANVAPDRAIAAADGVYAARVTVGDEEEMAVGAGKALGQGVAKRCGEKVFDAMAYLGVKPTFAATGERVLELHLFDFDGDLYGRRVTARLVGFVRGECRFASPDDLKAQIARDERATRALLGETKGLEKSASPKGSVDTEGRGAEIEFIRFTDTLHPLFAAVWRLYARSFPGEERRRLTTQRKIMAHPLYHFEVVTKGGSLIGLLLWWGFEELRYIEHLATMPRLRGRGYGARILGELVGRVSTPVVLEVEIPADEMSRRRVGFYERAGFVASEFDYTHPPYKSGGERVPLMLMSYPEGLTRELLARFLEKHAVIHQFTIGDKTHFNNNLNK